MPKYQIQNLGRNKFSGVIEAEGPQDILREVKKHLMSNDVEIFSEDGNKTFSVIVGGFRTVGYVKQLPFIIRG